MTQNDKSSDPRPLWQWSATEIATATHRGALSASEVVEAALDRLDAVNPDLNAVVEVCVDAARAEAKALDASDAPKGPLHGVPVTIKINVDQKGHATSNGVAAFKDVIAPDDAPVVANLRAAGAVIIGRTNTPEFSPCFGGRIIRRRRCLCDGWHRRIGAWKRHWWLSSVSGLCKRGCDGQTWAWSCARLEPKPNPRKGPIGAIHVGAGGHRTNR